MTSSASRIRFASACLAVAAAALCLPAQAATRRMALVVGNNAGGPLDKPLHYAEDDASKVADVLAQLGDVPSPDLLVLRGRGRKELKEAVARMGELVAGYRRNPDDRTVLLFYYSGHSDADALELGADRVLYSELRDWLRDTRADVRVLVADGCKSGALVQGKGATRGPPFEIKLSDQLDAEGEATLTSSAADELALESREIRGSIFTHHFVSGLRGAADASGDGRITLSEAYQYAFSHTLTASSVSGVRQHPGYEYRLAGKGELVLTEVARPSASIELPPDFERALIVLVRRDQVLAELTSDAARRVALAPGEYALRVWRGTRAFAARVTVAAGEEKQVTWSDLTSVSAPAVAGKGHMDEDRPEGLEGLSPEALAEYQEKYVGVGSKTIVTVGHNYARVEDTFEVYQGKFRKKLDEDAFYELAGRKDLATWYKNRRALKTTLVVGGIAAGVGGMASIVAELAGGPCNIPPGDPRFETECFKGPNVVLPIVLFASAAVLMSTGFALNEHPVEASEVRRLADQYNTGLVRRLERGPQREVQTALRFGVAPFASPGGGGGLLLGARF